MTKKGTPRVLRIVVMCALFAVPYVLSAPAGISTAGWKVLFIFLACIYGWIRLDVVATSLLGLVMLGFVDGYTVPGVFKTGFGSETFLLVMFMATFAGILEQVGLGERVANWVLRRRFSQRGPWFLSFALLIMAYCTAFVTSIMPGIIISWGILSDICNKCGFRRGDKWPMWMTVGIVLACCMGHSMWPIEVLALTLLNIYAQFESAGINYLAFTALNFTIGMLSILGYTFVVRTLFHPDVTKLAAAKELGRDMGPLTSEQKAITVFVVLFFAALFIPGAFPDAGGFIGLLSTIGTMGCGVVVICIAAMARTRKGRALVDVGAAIRDGVPWESLLLVAYTIPLASAMTSDAVGLNALIGTGFGTLFGGIGSAVVFSILYLLVIVICTNFMGNMAVGIISIPLMCAFAPTVGANAAMLCVVTCIACNAAMILPTGGPTAALLHGNRDWFETEGQIYKTASVAVAVFFAAATIAMLTLGNILPF